VESWYEKREWRRVEEGERGRKGRRGEVGGGIDRGEQREGGSAGAEPRSSF
jgi:hypothetical protein